MVLSYEEVHSVYSILLFHRGLAALGDFYDGTLHEVKKILEKFLPVFRADEGRISALVDVIRFFSILGCMIGTAVMEGEDAVGFDTTWLRTADVLPRSYIEFDPDCNFEVKLREICCTSKSELGRYLHNVGIAEKDLDILMDQLPDNIPLLSSSLGQASSALSELNTALTEMFSNEDLADDLQTTGWSKAFVFLVSFWVIVGQNSWMTADSWQNCWMTADKTAKMNSDVTRGG